MWSYKKQLFREPLNSLQKYNKINFHKTFERHFESFWQLLAVWMSLNEPNSNNGTNVFQSFGYSVKFRSFLFQRSILNIFWKFGPKISIIYSKNVFGHFLKVLCENQISPKIAFLPTCHISPKLEGFRKFRWW